MTPAEAVQLSLFGPEPATSRGESDDDLISTVRAEVTEPGMSEKEIDALVADRLDRTGPPDTAAPAPRCRCPRPLEFENAWLAVATCAKCGRLPRGAL